MEDAYEIFNYLPINKTSLAEQEYIDYLWQSFITLSETTDCSSFSIFPFHLLFMLSVQYKILRIFKNNKRQYQLVFTFAHTRNGDDDILTPISVFQFGTLRESTMFDLLKLVKLEDEVIKPCKAMVKNRNEQHAHAKGGIEPEPEVRIRQYIDLLKKIQKSFMRLNDVIAQKWRKNMGRGQDSIEYIESHLAEEYICAADMSQGKLVNLKKKLNKKIE